jgi:hypothetical protein
MKFVIGGALPAGPHSATRFAYGPLFDGDLDHQPSMITFEFFGVPRLRAGTGRVEVNASTLSAALEGVGRVCPALDGSVIQQGRVHPAYRVCLNGERFVSDPAMALADGDILLLMAADVGG